MINDDSKKIKELLEIINSKVGKLETHVSLHSVTLHLIKDQQSVLNEKLDGLQINVTSLQEDTDEIKKRLGVHGAALVNIESRLNGFADSWKINRAEINKVKQHLGLALISE